VRNHAPRIPCRRVKKKKRKTGEKKRETTLPGYRAAGLNGTRYLLWLLEEQQLWQKQQPNRTIQKGTRDVLPKKRRAKDSRRKWPCSRPSRLEEIKLFTGRQGRLKDII